MTIGVLLFLGYLGCGLLALCCHAARHARPSERFWVVTGGILVVLAAARWAGSYAPMADFLRQLLQNSSFYPEHRLIQLIAVVGFVAGLIILWFTLSRRSVWNDRGKAMTSAFLLCLLAFIGSRASSLHWVDIFLDVRLAGGLKRSQLIESALLLALGTSLIAVLIGAIRQGGALPKS